MYCGLPTRGNSQGVYRACSTVKLQSSSLKVGSSTWTRYTNPLRRYE